MPLTPVANPTSTALTLPDVTTVTGPMLQALTDALGVSRDIVATDDQIGHAWNNLPRLLSRIPAEHRTPTLARMCVAVAAGLFDSAINYVWNATISELRAKVRRFGLNVIVQVVGKAFTEESLIDLKDYDLLELCLKLNLITEEGYFLLDQCRDIRNNYSAAHPSLVMVDEDEFLSFLNRCGRHALTNERNPRGVDIQTFIAAVKAARFPQAQLEAWRDRINDTFDAQRELLFGTLHGIYCDPASGEEARVNALTISSIFVSIFTDRTKSSLVDRHQEYSAKGDEARHKASQVYFEQLGILNLLADTEMHYIVTQASKNLMTVHNSYNNFYGEPPFAERLAAIAAAAKIPESAQPAYVEAVVTPAVGNPWGVSHAAEPAYHKMVRSFSPNEIRIMLELSRSPSILASRLQSNGNCRTRFIDLLKMLDSSSVPTVVRANYESWLSGA